MGDKYEFVIVNLKVIAQVPRNRRLRTTSNGHFTLEDNHLLVPVRRTIYGEGRDKLVRDVKALLLEVSAQIRIHLVKNEQDGTHAIHGITADEKRINLEQIVGIHRELKKSITGFENLKGTYESDILMVSELEHMVDMIRSYMNEIEQKVPGIAAKEEEEYDCAPH